MKKLLVLLLAFTVIFAFASCGKDTKVGGESFIKYMEKDYEEEAVIAQIAKVDSLLGFEVIGSESGLVSLYKLDETAKTITTSIYDIANNKIVWTNVVNQKEYDATPGADNTSVVKSVELLSSYGVPYFIETTYSITLDETGSDEKVTGHVLYDAKGAVVAQCANNEFYTDGYDYYTTAGGRLVVFNGVAYFVDDEALTLTKAFDINEFGYFADKNSIMSYSDDAGYYYVAQLSSSGSDIEGITVINSAGNVVSNYYMRSGVEMISSLILSNGDFIVQYTRELIWDAKEYDFIESGTKYQLITEVLDVDKGTVKEINVDYIISYSAYIELSDNAKVSAIKVYFIENGYKVDEPETVLVDDSLNIKSVLSDFVDGAEDIWLLVDGAFGVEDKFGNIYILDSKGKIIKTLYNDAIENMNDKYAWTEKAIYTLPSFDKVYDLVANEQSVYDYGDDYIVLEKDVEDAEGNTGVEYTRFAQDTVSAPAVILNTLTTKDVTLNVGVGNLYILKMANPSQAVGAPLYVYEIYNGAGAKLIAIESNLVNFSVSTWYSNENDNIFMMFDKTFYILTPAQAAVTPAA